MKRRRPGLLAVTCVANAAAALMVARHAPPEVTPSTLTAPPPAKLGLVAAVPSPSQAPGEIKVRQVRRHHLLGPVIPASPPRVALNFVPTPPAPPPRPWTPMPHVGTPRAPWRQALDAALAAGGGDLPSKAGPVRLALPRDEAQAEADLAGKMPLIVALAEPAGPPSRGEWTLLTPQDDVLGGSKALKAWWTECHTPSLWLGRDGPGRVVFWLQPAVRGGWLAGREEAFELLARLLDDPRLRGKDEG